MLDICCEKPLDDSNGHEWFKRAEIVESTSGYWHIIEKN